jgi:hypothetical protein
LGANRSSARTRASIDSFTLRSNPEYEWMMYHFMFGFDGVADCSAVSAAGLSPLAAACSPGACLVAGWASALLTSSLICSSAMLPAS